MNRAERAAQAFLSDYNCAQAVAIAFCDVTGLDRRFTAKAVSSFGGGMGRLREVCGAASGMLFVLGCLYGYDTPGNDAEKKALYTRVQGLANQFRQKNGSIICREILKNPPSDPNPSPRTAEYYAKRPCVKMVMTAAEILEKWIAEHPAEP